MVDYFTSEHATLSLCANDRNLPRTTTKRLTIQAVFLKKDDLDSWLSI